MSIPVVIEPSQQSIVVPITITADGTPEGLHPVIVSVTADGYNTYENVLGGSGGDSVVVELSDPGVTTLFPVDDGHATDANVDGNVFESVVTHSPGILSHARLCLAVSVKRVASWNSTRQRFRWTPSLSRPCLHWM